MMDVRLCKMGVIKDNQYDFAVVAAAYKGKWLFVRHKAGETWEMPGGHREENESIGEAAARELFEETGVKAYEIEPVYDISVSDEGWERFGRLYYANVSAIGPLPDSEIGEVKMFKSMPGQLEGAWERTLTYPEIQPFLQDKVLEFLKGRALLRLKTDAVKNVNIINFINSYPIQTVDFAGDSLLIRGRSDEDWVYISSSSYKEFIKLLEGLDEADRCFAILDDWMLPDIIGNRVVWSKLTSIKLVYDPAAAARPDLPEVKSNVVRLSTKDAAYIYENSKYKEYISTGYIEERITNGLGLGVYADGKLAAWALTHDDGAIGFMNVLEEYRGRGYAKAVTAAMIKRLLEIGELPFVHIEEDNKASMGLALKTGFRKERRIHWIKLE